MNGNFSELLDEAAEVGPQQRAEVDVAKRRGQVAVEHPHHLLGRDPVGDQARDEGAGAGADVDVELVDRPVGRQQVERPQRADLIDAAGEAAAAEDERRLRRACGVRGAGDRLRLRSGGLDIDDLAHRPGDYRNRYTRTAHPAASARRVSPIPRRILRRRAGARRDAPPARRPRSPRSRRSPRRLAAAASGLSLGELRDQLADAIAEAGGASGAWVYDPEAAATVLFATTARRRRIPASNQKLFTTAAFLDQLGPR